MTKRLFDDNPLFGNHLLSDKVRCFQRRATCHVNEYVPRNFGDSELSLLAIGPRWLLTTQTAAVQLPAHTFLQAGTLMHAYDIQAYLST